MGEELSVLTNIFHSNRKLKTFEHEGNSLSISQEGNHIENEGKNIGASLEYGLINKSLTKTDPDKLALLKKASRRFGFKQKIASLKSLPKTEKKKNLESENLPSSKIGSLKKLLNKPNSQPLKISQILSSNDTVNNLK